MTTKPLITALALAISLYASQALARPDLTPEQLAKAKETASQMNPPIDVDEMLKEADRLGVECEGDLTLRYKIKMCYLRVDTAQSKEWIEASKKRQEASKERQAKLDEENAKLDEETAKILKETKQIAKEKLKQK
jgi:hypothetical protein